MLLGLLAWLSLSVPERVVFTSMVEAEGIHVQGSRLEGRIT